MYSYIAAKSVIVSLTLLFIPFSAYSSPNISLEYGFLTQVHENEDDQVFSDFIINLSDEYASSRFLASYDLTSDLIYEHLERENNTQWHGSLSSSYTVLKSLFLKLDLDLTELSLPGSTEIDQLNSQTYSTVSAGLEYVLDANIRGSLIVGLFTRIYSYEESPLDGIENIIELTYTYPLNSTSDLSLGYSKIEQKYDEKIERDNDAINDRLRVGYEKRFSRLIFNLFVDQNSVEYTNLPLKDDIEGYGFGLNYVINSRSSVSLELAKEIQQSFSVNSSLLDPQNPLFTSGLVENENYALQYNYQSLVNRLLLRVYQNDITNIAQTVPGERLQGVLFDYSYQINQKLSAGLNHNQYKNEISTNDFELTTARLDYQINKTRRTESSIGLVKEEGMEGELDREDTIIQFMFTGKIY